MVQWLRFHLSMQGVWIQSLVGVPHLATKKTIQKRSNIVANSRKTLKMVHVKKNYKNRNKIAEMSNRRVINSDKTWGGKEKRKAK